MNIYIEIWWANLNLQKFGEGGTQFFRCQVVFKNGYYFFFSSKFNPQPQRVGLAHVFADEDVVEIVART